ISLARPCPTPLHHNNLRPYRAEVLQTSALPLGYGAVEGLRGISWEERETGLEPATFCMASRRSTNRAMPATHKESSQRTKMSQGAPAVPIERYSSSYFAAERVQEWSRAMHRRRSSSQPG